MSAFLSIQSAAVAALLAEPPVSPRVRVGRDVPMPAAWADAVDVALQASGGRAITLDGRVSQWETVLSLQIKARAAAGAAGTAAVDPLLMAVFARLAQTAPPAGTQAWQIDPSVQWSVDEADSTVAVASLALRVSHLTGGASLLPVT